VCRNDKKTNRSYILLHIQCKQMYDLMKIIKNFIKISNCLTKPPKAPISYRTTAMFLESYSSYISPSPTEASFPFGLQFLANSSASESWGQSRDFHHFFYRKGQEGKTRGKKKGKWTESITLKFYFSQKHTFSMKKSD